MNKHTQLLGGILARIFRDGGHAQQALGDEGAASVADALLVRYRLICESVHHLYRHLEKVGLFTNVRHKSEHLLRVEECMRKGGQTVRSLPEMPTDPRERIRVVKLVIEEGLELARAMGVELLVDKGGGTKYWDAGQDKTDLDEAADALADLSVVTGGGFGALGIADLSLLELIDKNNLSKFEPPTCPDCGAVMEKVQLDLKAKGDEPALEMMGMKAGDKVGEMIVWQCPVGKTDHHLREEKEGPWIREDGKYMKPPYWKAPDVKGLLAAQRAEAESWKKEESLDFEDVLDLGDGVKVEWETESTPVVESAMNDEQRDDYMAKLKLRFWKNLPWWERSAALRGTLGGGVEKQERIPQTIEGQLIKQIRDAGMLTTFEREIDLAEGRHARTGNFVELEERFWRLTPQAKMAFWRGEVGKHTQPDPNYEYPTGVQDKMLEAYEHEPRRMKLQAYLDRVSPLQSKAAGIVTKADVHKAIKKSKELLPPLSARPGKSTKEQLAEIEQENTDASATTD